MKPLFSPHAQLRITTGPVVLKIILVLAFLFFPPSFLFAQDENSALRRFVEEKARLRGHPEGIAPEWRISSRIENRKTGFTYHYLQQEYKGIPVYNMIYPVVYKAGKYHALDIPFIPSLHKKVSATAPAISAATAVQRAIENVAPATSPPIKLISADPVRGEYVFEAVGAISSPARVMLCFVVSDTGVRLAWNVNLDLKRENHWWNVRIDALDGSFIEKDDWVVSCSFGEQDCSAYHHSQDHAPVPLPSGNTGGAFYNAFPFPVESPAHGSRQLIADPAASLPSPFGWHDTDGQTGAEFTITRGNNVFAYEDANNDDLPGYSPDGGPMLVFNHPFNKDSSVSHNRDAAITNLFYTNNYIHDILYPSGFDEPSGNFQVNNYGRGGLGNDHVLAEAQDGSGTNNANFATPPDGYNPRMQMYLWSAAAQTSCSSLEVLSPASIAGFKTIGTASFNPPSAFSLMMKSIVLAQDGVGTASDGCSALTNAAAISGKIAIIDRGTCDFATKVLNAQAAGAVGVIIANNVSGSTPPTMSGTPLSPVTIPTVSVTQSTGNSIKTQLSGGQTVNANLIICFPPGPRDASFDNGIIAHEFGHGVSNRLTGGPAAASCLGNAEQGGEGWSDWLALVTTIEPGDSGAMPRGIATYSVYQSPAGGGIRRFPYSTDMSINPQTYAAVGSSTTVHQRGEIWCDAIWDMTWFLIRDFGFDPDLINGSAGNNIAIRLVLEGMKLQPCSPGYIDGRDAILLADDILYGSAHRCQIWEAFARRGMGYNASQGSSLAVGDEVVDFTYPPFCLPPVTPPTANFSSLTTVGICPAVIRFTDQSTGNPQQWFWDFGDGFTSTRQNPSHEYKQPGSYDVKLRVTNTLGADSLVISDHITISTFNITLSASPASPCAGDTVQLSASVTGSDVISGYEVTSIPYAPLSGTGTTVSLADDAVSPQLPIGFTFRFFGVPYTGFHISSNGFIGFSPSMPDGCCIGQSLPSASQPNEIIAFAWNDLNPSVNSSVISYFTTGTSPQRKLVVRYNTNHWNGTAYPMRGQIILYEGSNAIEMHAEVISAVPDNVTTQGIENKSGVLAFYPPGRNASVFSAATDAWRFSPFVKFGYDWSPGGFMPSDTVTVPTVVPLLPSTYSVTMTDANGCTSNQQLPLSVPLCAPTLNLDLRIFIEGYLSAPGQMNPVLFNNNLSNDPAQCDSVTVELRDTLQPATVVYSTFGLLSVNGEISLQIPASFYTHRYYLVIRSRNGIETWSKAPVTLSAKTLLDLTE